MKKAVNIRLDEQIIYTINQLSAEFNTTKTEVIEMAIKFFSNENKIKQNNLLKFAGALKASEADAMLNAIKEDKTLKDKDFQL